VEYKFKLHEILPDHTKLSKFFSFSFDKAVLWLEIDFSVLTAQGLPKLAVMVKQKFRKLIKVRTSTNETLHISKGSVAVTHGGRMEEGRSHKGK
jgi:hypothetical protein